MTQADFIQAVQNQLGPDTKVLKSTIKQVLDAAGEVRLALLGDGESVQLDGLGSIKVVQRAARVGRNPRTGAALAIPAKNGATYKPSKAVKDALSS